MSGVPIRMCLECFIVMPAACKHCPNCGRLQRSNLSGDITASDWTIISRDERFITVGGRHFFAGRCTHSGARFWKIEEVDRPPPGPMRSIRVLTDVVATRKLSFALEAALRREVAP